MNEDPRMHAYMAARPALISSPPSLSGHGELQTEHVESAAELSTILDGFDDLMITYADQRMFDDPVWTQMKAQRQALLEIMA